MSLILFAGVAYVGGCFNYDSSLDLLVFWLTPAFFLLLSLSWRRIEAQTLYDPLSRWAKGVYIVTLAVIALLGFGLNYLISDNRTLFTSIAQGLLNSQTPRDTSGMDEQPELGSTFGLQGSSERVLLVRGSLTDPHLRGASFDYYKSRTWGPMTNYRTFIPCPAVLGVPSTLDTVVHILKLGYASGFIYYPLDAASLDLDQQENLQWSPNNAGPIRSNSLGRSSYSFTESSTNGDFTDRPIVSSALARDLVVPSQIDPAVITLTRKITRGKSTALAKIQAICADLDSKHGYSLTYTAGNGDPVSGFILGDKPAHCEYFASAAVIMLRCADIPARYVIGYYAHEQDDDGNIVVRQRDAHAWAEAFVQGGWITVDATPAGGRPDKLYSAPTRWDEFVDDIEDRIQLLQDEASEIGPGKIFAGAVFLIGIYLLARILIKELAGRGARAKASGKARQSVPDCGQRFIKLLEKRRIDIPPGKTWQEFFEDSRDVPLKRETVLKFVVEYNAYRFGGGNMEELNELLDELERYEPMKANV